MRLVPTFLGLTAGKHPSREKTIPLRSSTGVWTFPNAPLRKTSGHLRSSRPTTIATLFDRLYRSFSTTGSTFMRSTTGRMMAASNSSKSSRYFGRTSRLRGSQRAAPTVISNGARSSTVKMKSLGGIRAAGSCITTATKFEPPHGPAYRFAPRCMWRSVQASTLSISRCDFRPVDDRFMEDADPEVALPFFEFGRRPGHFVQCKAWRQPAESVNLRGSGGHEARFEGRRIFPYKFLLKHYPLRNPGQARRKIFTKRQGRFSPREDR